MSYYDYDYFKDNMIGIGWLDMSARIKDSTALALSRNITEYWVQENANYDVKTCCIDNAEDILAWADGENLNFVLVLATGNNLSRRYQLFHELPKYLENNKDISVTGHILDKDDHYYELHHQCFLINLNWWRSVGKPKLGSEELGIWTTLEPTRSVENWHDGYTPHWIEKGNHVKDYKGKRFGWKIIETALADGKRISSFDEVIRNSKYYVYPEVEKDFHSKISPIYNSLQSYTHFVANTETPPTGKNDVNFDSAICTAGGLTPLLVAYSCKLKEHSKLSIFDFSPLALEIQKKFREHNCDFKNFKDDFLKIEKDLYNPLFKAIDNIDKMQEIINQMRPKGLEDYIKNVWPHLDVRYFNIDLLDLYSLKDMLSRHAGDRCLIHLSNILHYQHNAWLFNSSHRYQIENALVNIFSKYGDETFYLLQNRPGVALNWRYITPSQIKKNETQYLKRVDELKILPWIQH